MQIHSLAEKDTKLLTSGQIIVNVVSIIKELLENSIDACATSISITLEGHGLDSIIVKDNGQGIPVDDRPLLALNHCTSKISTFHDLRSVNTYGFRGEALFSLAEISQRFRLTTRTPFDAVATVLERTSNGELKVVKTSSESTGTTVTITKPWHKMPVRRDRSRRETKDLFVKIKQLMHTYSLVHPSLRLQVASKTSKITEQASILMILSQKSSEETISAFIGKEALENCASTSVTARGTKLQAVLPKVNASCTVANKGHFLYVNRRPISCRFECFKQILVKIRTKINLFAPEAGHNPFIFLNIICATDKYDPNIEPSKNNVMLFNSDEVDEAICLLFATVYGQDPTGQSSKHQSPGTIENDLHCVSYEGSKTIQPSNPKVIVSTQEHEINGSCQSDPNNKKGEGSANSTTADPQSAHSRNDAQWKFSMFDEDSEEQQPEISPTKESDTNAEIDYVPNRTNLNNPWTLAKMITKRKRSHAMQRLPAPNEPSSDVLLDHEACLTSEPFKDPQLLKDATSFKTTTPTDGCAINATELQASKRSRKGFSTDTNRCSIKLNRAMQSCGVRSTDNVSRRQRQAYTEERLQPVIFTGNPTLHADKKGYRYPSLINDGIARDSALREHPRLYLKANSANTFIQEQRITKTSHAREEDGSLATELGTRKRHIGAHGMSTKPRIALEGTEIADQVQGLRIKLQVNMLSICAEAESYASDTIQVPRDHYTRSEEEAGVFKIIGPLAGNMHLSKLVNKRNRMTALYVEREDVAIPDLQRPASVDLSNKASKLKDCSRIRIW